VRGAPADAGTLELIARRPAEEQREILDTGELDLRVGLVGDMWAERPSSSTPDGGPNPEAQVTLMSARAVALVAAGDEHERWAQAGDQLYVDLDLSQENLPPGTRLRIGDAVLEVTEAPHLGCGKFSRRFGVDALKFVNSKVGRELRLRGVNARVVEPGAIATGDEVRKLDGAG
jgi:MOSC domain-containing protein YiiM